MFLYSFLIIINIFNLSFQYIFVTQMPFSTICLSYMIYGLLYCLLLPVLFIYHSMNFVFFIFVKPRQTNLQAHVAIFLIVIYCLYCLCMWFCCFRFLYLLCLSAYGHSSLVVDLFEYFRHIMQISWLAKVKSAVQLCTFSLRISYSFCCSSNILLYNTVCI